MKSRSIAGLLIAALALAGVTGCGNTNWVKQAQDDLAASQTVYNATTQATADAKSKVAALPPSSPGLAQATAAVAVAEKGEAIAGKALDVATSTLTAIQSGNLNDPALAKNVSAAIGLVPGPYTPLLQVLSGVVIGAVGYGLQQYKLGKAHGQIQAGNAAATSGLASIAPATPSPPPPPGSTVPGSVTVGQVPLQVQLDLAAKSAVVAPTVSAAPIAAS